MAQKPWMEFETPGHATLKPWQVKPVGQVGSVCELVVRIPSGQGAATRTDWAKKKARRAGKHFRALHFIDWANFILSCGPALSKATPLCLRVQPEHSAA